MDVQQRGPVAGTTGTPVPFTAGLTGQSRTSDVHGRYMQEVLEGRVFFGSLAAAAPTAYVGGAAGTPLICIHNPLNSGKVLVPLMVGFAQRAAATAAGQTGLALWAGTSAEPTGSWTNPRSALSFSLTGAAAKYFANVALTGSSALNLVLPLYTHYWATAASAWSAPAMFDVGGIVSAAPGSQIALGLTVVPTSVTVDVSMLWAEVPYLP